MNKEKTLSKIAAFLLSGMMTVTIVAGNSYLASQTLDVFASEAKNEVHDFSEYGTGMLPITDNQLEEYIDSISVDFNEEQSVMSMNSTLSLPSSYDLSTSPYFPPIGNQQSIGSCAAWATTYYQFTYEANKLNNIVSTADNAYSPRWTYNMVNGGQNVGTYFGRVYDVLKRNGSLTMSEYPYLADGVTWAYTDNFDFSWSDDTDLMINALNTRISGNEHAVSVSSTNPSSTELDKIRELLYNGKILTFTTDFAWDYRDRNILNADGSVGGYINPNTGIAERIVYRAYNNNESGHAMTIVGYDNNVWSDINNNGIVDEGELGAFKIANSWGSDWENNGYIWVSYDALNSTTTIDGNWESELTGDRVPAFTQGNSGNYVYYIEVENKDVYYVGQLTLNTSYRNSLNISAGRNLSSNINAYNFNSKFITQGNASTELSHVGTLVFDYDDLAEPIGEYISGYNWFVRLNGNHNNASFKITDNLSNTIVDFGSISAGDSYMPISLSMGDLNYDGVVNSVDTEILYNARNNGTALSNLQEYLATNMDTPIQDYTVDYIVAADWGTGRNIQITITNTGDVAIRNWALQCSNFEGDISNPWNCTLLGDDIIKNAMYNSDIAVGQSVTFGYTLTNATGEIPVFSLCTFRSAKQNGYDVSLDVTSEWDSGFIGNITITNTTNEPIMAWELSFTAVNFTITGGGQFEILENSGNNYTITGTYNGNIPIPANTSITMQFNGTKNGTPALSNVSMTEMVIEN